MLNRATGSVGFTREKPRGLKSACESCVVPTGLGSISRFTQHSACGCVLG